MKVRFLLMLAIGFVIIFTIYSNISSKPSTIVDEKPQVGFKAPNFSLPNLHTGEKIDLHKLKKPVVINFWASWCAPCRDEAPDFQTLYEKYNGKVEVLAVNLTHSDQLNEVADFVDAFGLQFPILLDQKEPPKSVTDKYQILSIPTTFFVNEDGVIIHQIIGYASKKDLEKYFSQLVEEN